MNSRIPLDFVGRVGRIPVGFTRSSSPFLAHWEDEIVWDNSLREVDSGQQRGTGPREHGSGETGSREHGARENGARETGQGAEEANQNRNQGDTQEKKAPLKQPGRVLVTADMAYVYGRERESDRVDNPSHSVPFVSRAYFVTRWGEDGTPHSSRALAFADVERGLGLRGFESLPHDQRLPGEALHDWDERCWLDNLKGIVSYVYATPTTMLKKKNHIFIHIYYFFSRTDMLALI